MEQIEGQEPALRGRLDLGRIGVAGHSFGATTALMLAGLVWLAPEGEEQVLADPRVRAVVSMSAPARRYKDQPDRFERIYGRIRLPCLHLTGTNDESPIGLTAAVDRRVPFDHIRAENQYLVIFEGGDHMVFAGNKRRTEAARNDPVLHELIQGVTTAFWDAYLRGDAAVCQRLAEGMLATLVGGHGAVEQK